MKELQNKLFSRWSESEGEINHEMIDPLPNKYKELVGDKCEIWLNDQIWFPYTKDGKQHEYCISCLYGLTQIPKELNQLIEAFDDPYEELFFYGLIPFATEDGHTGLAFKYEEERKEYEVYFVDYEWQDYYKVADSFNEFMDMSYVQSAKYTYEVLEVTDDLMSVINLWMSDVFSENANFSVEDVEENMTQGIKDLYRERGKVAVNIKNNLYYDGSSYRENLRKDAKIILTIMPRGHYTEELEDKEAKNYLELHEKLIKLENVKPIRTFGNLSLEWVSNI